MPVLTGFTGGADVRQGGAGADIMFALDGADSLSGLGGNDELSGDRGADTLLGGQGADSLFGGADNDRLDGGAGSDRMEGGAGNDVYIVNSSGDRIVEAANGGTDTINTTVSFTLDDSVHVEVLQASGNGSMSLRGNSRANRIRVNGQAGTFGSTLDGRGGADTLTGGRGRDVFSDTGLNDNDVMIDEFADQDTYHYGRQAGRDTVRDSGGVDIVRIDPGINPGDVRFARRAGTNSLVMTIAGQDGNQHSMTFENYYNDNSASGYGAGRIELFEMLDTGELLDPDRQAPPTPAGRRAAARSAVASAASPVQQQAGTLLQAMSAFGAAGAAGGGVAQQDRPGAIDLAAPAG